MKNALSVGGTQQVVGAMLLSLILRFSAIAFCMLACAAAAENEETAGVPPALAQQPRIPLERFVRLRADMSKPDVDKLLETPGEHYCTYVAEDGGVYAFLSYEVAESGYSFELMFKDGNLFSVIDGYEEHEHFKALPKDSPVFSGSAFDDDLRIKEVFKVKSLRGEGIAKSMPVVQERVLKSEREWKEAIKGREPNLAALAALQLMNLKPEYEMNAEQAKKFDSAKVTIGMSEKEVDQIYGAPRYTEGLKESFRVALYGPDQLRHLVNQEVIASPVMVLFRDGKAFRVMSHSYFEDSWRKKVWPD